MKPATLELMALQHDAAALGAWHLEACCGRALAGDVDAVDHCADVIATLRQGDVDTLARLIRREGGAL